jgi:hypothetical protein
MQTNEPYADIHHFEPGNQTGLVDDDGDTLCGWYFQLMRAIGPITSLIGPYGSRGAAESAAIVEYGSLA